MSIERIELRKKYYDGNMVREAVMSVADDYNTIMKLLKAFSSQPSLTDVTEVVRCKDCRWWERDYQSRYHPDERPCNMLGLGTPPEWFCADGERRERE